MIEIIPAIDLIGGKCVRLSKGDYSTKKEYNSNPLEVAKNFEDHGIRRLHLVDLDGAKARKVVNLDVLETIASKTSLHVDFGGGVQSEEDLRKVLDAGAKQVTGGSIAVREPEVFEGWLKDFGPEQLILGADAHEGKIAVGAWSENSGLDIKYFVSSYVKKGIKYCISTDVSKDGMLSGPSYELYEDLQEAFPDLNIIASGGISHIDEVYKLNDMGMYGVIIGKAIYEGHISLPQLKPFL